MLCLLASALSFAPALAPIARVVNHAMVCKCAHCPGEALCCCHGDVAQCPIK